MNRKLRYFDQSVNVPEDWLQSIQTTEANLYKTGERIYRQEETAHHFYYLKKGRIQAFVTSPDGTEKKLTSYGPGDIFGEASFFDGFPRISSARAQEDSLVISLNQTDVLSLFQAHPTFAFTLMVHLSKKVRMLSREIDDLTFLTAEKRIAQYLLQQGDQNNGLIKGTQEEIGNAVGVRRVTVSRILRQFAQKKWIATRYRQIEILDPTSLKRFHLEP
ncbi:Crp/Fnr family transcriptional regulator [Alkalibacter rhizosphaerae]|uniref:Crp/Fnr family transcriptional regulator n=1 Tax=Alkalibacter rhizosphaerae TaxID=2815577 RepID=A0A974XMC5_9FIRM|nr:Crp/Fnr family transcriptional regulator [Alkalibacter rhizosphaerae]QSX08566.1 Crp/Fnr family transcriptional regulator [Alkalibacter rhizosphaerae]